MPEVGSARIYRLKDFQERAGNLILNVYHYISDVPVVLPTAVEVGQAWIAQVLPDILTVQSDAVTHTILECDRLEAVDDFGEIDLASVPGDKIGETMPAYCAVRFDYLRTTKETRNGYKFVGVPIADDIEGDFLSAAYQVECNGVATALAEHLTPGIFNVPPIILSPRYEIVDEEKVLLPIQEWFYNFVSDVVAQPLLSNQVKRKRGSGV